MCDGLRKAWDIEPALAGGRIVGASQARVPRPVRLVCLQLASEVCSLFIETLGGRYLKPDVGKLATLAIRPLKSAHQPDEVALGFALGSFCRER